MRKKQYDDDLLVELIARGRVSNREIARQVGVTPSTVSRIVSGTTRADLQPRIRIRIDRNRRRALAEIERLKRELAAAKAPKRPRRDMKRGDMKRGDYDDDLLVELLAEGDLSFQAIADEVGICRAMVGQIARGERRPHLYERINRTFRTNIRKTRNRGAHRLPRILDLHADKGEADGESARKCREFLLKTFLEMPCDESPAESAEPPFANFMKLSPDTRKRIAADLGGPEPDDMEDEVDSCPR